MRFQSQAEIEKALEGKKVLTRPELADQLEKKGMLVHRQRLSHILAYAELNGLFIVVQEEANNSLALCLRTGFQNTGR